MIGITAALALAIAAPPPLPDGKSIDALSFHFSSGIPGLSPSGVLNITADGKVNYSHQTAPSTGSGGKVTQKKWELTKAEVAELFRKLVADGLLDIPEAAGKHAANEFTVYSGRWQLALPTEKVPEKVLAHLRPLLVKAHPALWEKPVMEKPKLTHLQYSFTPKAEGEESTITIDRAGNITYKRRTHPAKPGGSKVLV
ncbi:MAG: hypothetical protein L0241_00140, partial [Planctomycetia bacterium]|nr:hypothetical protein [Planctomycetia bacterium]